MTRWEYRLATVHAPAAKESAADLEVLDELGAEGWEAVGFSPTTAVGHGLREVETVSYLVLLKRPRDGRRR